jgi:hypothetical protein
MVWGLYKISTDFLFCAESDRVARVTRAVAAGDRDTLIALLSDSAFAIDQLHPHALDMYMRALHECAERGPLTRQSIETAVNRKLFLQPNIS